jgi:hypothetical protein
MTIVIYEMYINLVYVKVYYVAQFVIAPLSLFFKYVFVLTCVFLSQDKIALV